MTEAKNRKYTIGIVLIILGIIFLPFLFQIIAFTGTVFLTPEQVNEEFEEKSEKGELEDGDSWWVYGWIQEKEEVPEEDKAIVGDYKYYYTFKRNLATEETDDNNTVGFYSNEDYYVNTDILVQIEIDMVEVDLGGGYIMVLPLGKEASRLAFPIPEVAGIVLLVIGLILFIQGRKVKKGADAKQEQLQANTFNQGELAGFSQGTGQQQGGAPMPSLSQNSPQGFQQPQGPMPGPQMPQTPQVPLPQMGGFPQQPSQPMGAPGFPSAPGGMPGHPPGFPQQQAPQQPSGPIFPQGQGPSQIPGGYQSPEIHQGNVGVPIYVKCPACGEKMEAPAIRPARVQCQKCGTRGTIN